MPQANAMEQPAGGRGSEDDSQVDLVPGTLIEARYRVVGVLGEGGVGVVYRADDLKLPRQVAIKVLQGRHVDHTSLRTRFAREAHALAALSHPNIVHVSDYGTIDGKPFVVMELLEGQTLREIIDQGPVAPERTFTIVRQLLKGLAYAHSHGLVHRDVKPGNIFLQQLDADTELVKILDFGFAKFLSGDAAGDPNVSQEGVAFGTPSYLAPEQATGAPTDIRADVYSTGVVLFEMLAGIKPFQGSLLDVVRAHLTARVPRISTVCRTRRETPELRKLLERAMAKRPQDRFEHASTFLRAIDALPKPAIHVRKRGRVSIAGIVLVVVSSAVAGTITWVALQPDPGAIIDGWLASAGSAFGGGDERGVDPGRGTETETGAVAETETGAGTETETGAVAETETGAVAGTETGAVAETETGADTPAEPVLQPENAAAAELLGRVRATIDAGEPVSDEAIAELRTYVRDGRDLAGAHLLLGHAYISRGWVTNALHHYEQAHDADPRVKEDPLMLRNLIGVTTRSPNLDIEANHWIQRIWGPDALPEVERAMADPATPGPGRARLHRLKRTLERMRPAE